MYIVIYEDRHADTDAQVYANRADAIEAAEEMLAENLRHPEDLDQDLNDMMKRDGWIWYAAYSCEGDNIRVLHRELR